jgi:hypothetical protein
VADYYGGTAMPGPSAVSITTERTALLGPITWYLLKGIVIKGSATSDAGNTPTTELRHGLLLGQRNADGYHAHYNPVGTDGTQLCQGFLFEPRRTIDSDGLTVDRPAQMVIAGYVDSTFLSLLDEQARRQMNPRFLFDDRLVGPVGGYSQTLAKTANYTVVAATDNNTHFTTTGAAGAVTFTLPAVSKGARFRFTNTAGQNMTVAGPAGTLVTFNNVAATSVTLSTAGQLIGGTIEIVANDDGTKWLVIPHGSNTITVA